MMIYLTQDLEKQNQSSTQQFFCETHEGEEIKFFCEEDEMYLCPLCFAEFHQGHTVSYFTENDFLNFAQKSIQRIE